MQCWSLHALNQPVSSHQLEERPRYKGNHSFENNLLIRNNNEKFRVLSLIEIKLLIFKRKLFQTLAEILSEREMICHLMENILDEATRPWGVKVERVEIKVNIFSEWRLERFGDYIPPSPPNLYQPRHHHNIHTHQTTLSL